MTPGAQIYIHSGPYAGCYATIDCVTAEGLGVTLASAPGQAKRAVSVLAGDVERVA